MIEYLLYLYVESPLHAGAGGTVDGLDLPIQREATTSYPVVWGQSLKGALRQAARNAAARSVDGWTSSGKDSVVDAVFGPDVGTVEEDDRRRAGALSVGDAQLVAMPVPTLQRTFAWVSTPIALGRLARKYRALGRVAPPLPSVPDDAGGAPGDPWTSSGIPEVLGAHTVPLNAASELQEWARTLSEQAVCPGTEFEWFAQKLAEDLLLVGDDIAPELLRECTEQSVRVKLAEDTKTVKDGQGPFYSEYLPTETILASSLTLRTTADAGLDTALRSLLNEQVIQIGGDETLGKGLTRCRLIPKESS